MTNINDEIKNRVDFLGRCWSRFVQIVMVKRCEDGLTFVNLAIVKQRVNHAGSFRNDVMLSDLDIVSKNWRCNFSEKPTDVFNKTLNKFPEYNEITCIWLILSASSELTL